jgi:hypothetical protein
MGIGRAALGRPPAQGPLASCSSPTCCSRRLGPDPGDVRTWRELAAMVAEPENRR